jgi:DNA-nicking Smr family endonuclease
MNRDGGGRPGDKPRSQSPRHSSRAGRQITEEEAALWEQLGRSLDKVKKKARVPAHAETAAGSDGLPDVGSRASRGADARVRSPRPGGAPPARLQAAGPRPAIPARAPAPAEIDRRTLRQVGSGKLPIDAVLDLHGLTQEAAHYRLRGFLMACQRDGLRMVLVITGKGGKADRSAADDHWATGASPRGVLRRSVPMWLDEPEMRPLVVSYAAAGLRHGGEGALYIRLRKPRGG